VVEFTLTREAWISMSAARSSGKQLCETGSSNGCNRIEKPYALKIVRHHHENQPKTTLNLNFAFEKSRMGKSIGMTDKPVSKPINRSPDNG
jgi:hypothetical protein